MGPHSSRSRRLGRSSRSLCIGQKKSRLTFFKMWALSLPLTLLFVVVASSAPTVTKEVIEDTEDFIGISLQQPSYPTYIHPFRNGEAPAPRHLAKRSPICKRSASPCIIAKTLKKAKLLKKFGTVGLAAQAPALLAPLAELGVIGGVAGTAGDWARRSDLRSPSNSAALLVDEIGKKSKMLTEFHQIVAHPSVTFYLRYAGLHVAIFYPIFREGLNLPTTIFAIFMEGLNLPTTTVFKISNNLFSWKVLIFQQRVFHHSS